MFPSSFGKLDELLLEHLETCSFFFFFKKLYSSTSTIMLFIFLIYFPDKPILGNPCEKRCSDIHFSNISFATEFNRCVWLPASPGQDVMGFPSNICGYPSQGSKNMLSVPEPPESCPTSKVSMKVVWQGLSPGDQIARLNTAFPLLATYWFLSDSLSVMWLY